MEFLPSGGSITTRHFYGGGESESGKALNPDDSFRPKSDKVLQQIGEEGWVTKLPLAASGPGEPFASAVGVLGVMTIWRAYYTTFIDNFSLSANNETAER